MKPSVLQNLLRDAMRNNPKGSEREIYDACFDTAKGSAAVQKALFQYWFKNSYRDFMVAELGPHSIAIMPVSRREAGEREAKAQKVSHIVARMEARLMDRVLSDGTELRNATFGQCQREGGWLIAIGKAGKANEVVGKKLTEKDLRNLMARVSAPAKRAA